MSRVTLVRWRPASEPPTGDTKRRVLAHSVMGGGMVYVPAFTIVKAPEWFSWWCDPVPPDGGALTTDDVRWAVERAEYEEHLTYHRAPLEHDKTRARADRLRRALAVAEDNPRNETGTALATDDHA